MGEGRYKIADEENSNAEVRSIEREIRYTRARLGSYLSELNRRRHRYAKAFKRIGGAMLSIVGILISIRLFNKLRS